MNYSLDVYIGFICDVIKFTKISFKLFNKQVTCFYQTQLFHINISN